MDEVLTYKNGLKNAHTFIIFDIDKEKYVNYLKNLASKHNNQFLKGVADGLEQIRQEHNHEKQNAEIDA